MDSTFDEGTLWRLRVAASLATALPMRVLLTDSTRLLFEVRRPPLPDHPGGVFVPPCRFRAAVASARSSVLAADSPLTETMVGAGELGISLVLQHDGASLPGGIWRLDHPGSSVYVFVTGLWIRAARAAVGSAPEVAALDPGFLADPGTGVTLVSATAPSGADPASTLDAVHGMLARCTAAELLAEVGASAPGGRRQQP